MIKKLIATPFQVIFRSEESLENQIEKYKENKCPEVAEEIINLQAILNLPKGTELFLSDIHGEYGSFSHILNNGSGIIRNKIEDIFNGQGITEAIHTKDNMDGVDQTINYIKKQNKPVDVKSDGRIQIVD